MEAWTTTLAPDEGWRLLGSTPEKTPVEVILRAIDGPVEFAAGATSRMPDGKPVVVPPGEGARLSGLHFFARLAGAGAPSRVVVRGI